MQLKYFLLFILSVFLLACEKLPYRTITVETGWGRENIPGDCGAWNDGCWIYCRTNQTTGYARYAQKDKCNTADVVRAFCMEDSQQLRVLPPRFSRLSSGDQCLREVIPSN